MGQVRRTQFGRSTRGRYLGGELDLDATAFSHGFPRAGVIGSAAGNRDDDRPKAERRFGRGGSEFPAHRDDVDFDPKVTALREQGLEVPVHQFPGSEGFRQASRSAYATDPDGHLVEFWTADMLVAYGEG